MTRSITTFRRGVGVLLTGAFAAGLMAVAASPATAAPTPTSQVAPTQVASTPKVAAVKPEVSAVQTAAISASALPLTLKQRAVGYNLDAGPNHKHAGPKYWSGLFRDGKLCNGYDEGDGNGPNTTFPTTALPTMPNKAASQAGAIIMGTWTDITGLTTTEANNQGTAVRISMFKLQRSKKFLKDEAGYYTKLRKDYGKAVADDIKAQVVMMLSIAEQVGNQSIKPKATVSKAVAAGDHTTLTVVTMAGTTAVPNMLVSVSVKHGSVTKTIARTNAKGEAKFSLAAYVGKVSGKVEARVPADRINGNIPTADHQQLYWAKWKIASTTFSFFKQIAKADADCEPVCTGNPPVDYSFTTGGSTTKCTIKLNDITKKTLTLAPNTSIKGRLTGGVHHDVVTIVCEIQLPDGDWTPPVTTKRHVIDCPPAIILTFKGTCACGGTVVNAGWSSTVNNGTSDQIVTIGDKEYTVAPGHSLEKGVTVPFAANLVVTVKVKSDSGEWITHVQFPGSGN